jgi:SAM-dependent methyltransferase
MSDVGAPNGVGEWIASPLGRHLFEREQKYFDEAVADIFGYNAFQLGMSEVDLLRGSRIPLRCRVAASGRADVVTDFRDLPLASNSADLVLLPHVLEFAEHPHQILREVERVLMPEGGRAVGLQSVEPVGLAPRFPSR